MHQIKLACLGAFLHKNWTGLILLICVFFHTFRKKNLLIQKGFLKKYLQVCKTSCWEISYEGGGGGGGVDWILDNWRWHKISMYSMY